jgi:hypothetical protein
MDTRSLTSQKRDIVHQLIDDDPRRAALVVDLLVATDSETSSGYATRADLLREAYSFTTDFKQSLTEFTVTRAALFLCLIAYALDIVS